MYWLLITLTLFNILAVIHCFFTWREVWGLRGGYGKGVWSEQYGGYLYLARESRFNSTLFVLVYTALLGFIWVGE